MNAQILKSNKYLNQLISFPDISFILENLIVPTSVVFTWNRISLLLKGMAYESFDWQNVSGCDVDGEFFVQKEDISNLMLSTTTDGEFSTANLIHGYSFNPLPENSYFLLSTLSEDYDNYEAEKNREESKLDFLLNSHQNFTAAEIGISRKNRPILSRIRQPSVVQLNSDDAIIEEEEEEEESGGEGNESSDDYSDVSSIPPNSQMSTGHHLRNFSSVSLTRGENDVDVFPKMDVRTPSIVAREQRGETVSTHRRTPSMGIVSRHVDDYSSLGVRSSKGSRVSSEK